MSRKLDEKTPPADKLPGIDAPLTFQGFSPETYRFFIELSLNNNKVFFDENRARYIEHVQTPMRALAADLMPHMLRVDPGFNTKMVSVVSRIYRDARRLFGSPPYRDHLWMSFKHPTGPDEPDHFGMYFEVSPGGYGYGLGIYQPSPAFMTAVRAGIIADPTRFLNLCHAAGMERYTLEGESFKRDRFHDVPDEVKPYLNMRRMSWCYFCEDLAPTLNGETLFQEVCTELVKLGPLYRYIMEASATARDE